MDISKQYKGVTHWVGMDRIPMREEIEKNYTLHPTHKPATELNTKLHKKREFRSGVAFS